jgi:hypothetical protein
MWLKQNPQPVVKLEYFMIHIDFLNDKGSE